LGTFLPCGRMSMCQGSNGNNVSEVAETGVDSAVFAKRFSNRGLVGFCYFSVVLLLAGLIAGGSRAQEPAPQSEVAFCLKCHAAPGLRRPPVSAKKPPLKRIDPREFAASAHGKLLSCTDCHKPHAGEPLPAVSRWTAKTSMSAKCSNCHVKEGEQYRQSIHWKALQAGNTDSPACFNCHGEHSITSPRRADSRVSPAHVTETCSSCHENTAIQQRNDLPKARLATYRESYHGIANRFGQLEAANCASCHGYHDVKPSSDPTSPINKRNLPKTCGRCHPGATENFAKGTIHLQPSPTEDAIVYWVRLIYRVFVFTVIASLCGLMVLDLFARLRTALRGSTLHGENRENEQ